MYPLRCPRAAVTKFRIVLNSLVHEEKEVIKVELPKWLAERLGRYAERYDLRRGALSKAVVEILERELGGPQPSAGGSTGRWGWAPLRQGCGAARVWPRPRGVYLIDANVFLELLYRRQRWKESYRFLEKVRACEVKGHVL